MRALENDLVGILDQFEDATPEIIVEALEPTFEKSKVYCPKDTGELVASGYLEIVRKGQSPYVEMGYGKGGKPRYAPYVHEMLNLKHAAPTRAKWLQHAVQEDLGVIATRLATGYTKFMSRQGAGKSSGKRSTGSKIRARKKK